MLRGLGISVHPLLHERGQNCTRQAQHKPNEPRGQRREICARRTPEENQ